MLSAAFAFGESHLSAAPSFSIMATPADGVPHSLDAFAQAYHAFLQAHVRRGGVDYVAAARDPRRSLIRDAMAQVDWDQLSSDGQKAFLIDAYNFWVIDLICERMPLASVMDVEGFFDKLRIAGPQGTQTLDGLEKGVLYKRFADPRLHFVLVCGAKGCPELENAAFSVDPTKLDLRLERATKRALQNPGLVAEGKKGVTLSRIFEWYASDFGSNQHAVLGWINRYRDAPLPSQAQVMYSSYDWSLNAVFER